ncbi:MAG: hypothetical protein SGCHY_000634 [Lobulomycetales sp.]
MLRIFRRSLFIQTEATPNKDSLKFIPTGKTVLGPGAGTLEFLSFSDAQRSPLAQALFKIEGVESVMYGPEWISISKQQDSQWQLMKPDIFAKIMDFYSADDTAELFPESTGETEAPDTKILPTDSETVAMIKELIETRIRPTIQEDGGDLEYCGLTPEGVVQVKLKGACRTCDSSVVTLKNGIENMLMHYIPEITGVEQIESEAELAGNEAFLKFEEKLKSLKNQS